MPVNNRGRRSPLQDFIRRFDAAKSDERRVALIKSTKPAVLQAVIAALSLEDQIRLVVQGNPERRALYKAKGVKFNKLLNAQREEIKATIEVILAPMPLNAQCEFMRTDKNPEWAAFLKAKGINVTIPGDAVVIVGGDTKHHGGRRWGKGEWIQEAFRVLLGFSPPDKQPNMIFLTDQVRTYLVEHAGFSRERPVSYRHVCRIYKKWCEANQSPRMQNW
jgi:hypothetical protein